MAKTKLVNLRVRPRTVAVWQAAAAQAEISVSELVRRAADRYSRELLTEATRPAAANSNDRT